MSLSSAADLIEDHVDATSGNKVYWVVWLALIVALSHFPMLEPELELLGSKRNADLIDG
jgi:hypothetical protein